MHYIQWFVPNWDLANSSDVDTYCLYLSNRFQFSVINKLVFNLTAQQYRFLI